MPRARCPECAEPMEFDDRRRAFVCHDCEQVEAVDTALRDADRTPDVNEYDEEDRP